MPLRRLPVKLLRQEAMRVSRVVVGKQKLVYFIVADKRLEYEDGRSRIAYIGTTKTGVTRVAQSAAARTEDVFGQRGVLEFHTRIITCKPRQRVKTWHKLERACLLVFRERFGEVPLCNSQGNKMKETDEFSYFARSRIERIIDDLS